MGIEVPQLRTQHLLQYEREFIKRKSYVDIPKNHLEEYGDAIHHDPLKEGHDIISNINEILNKFSRHPLQCQMHESMIKCCSKLIFGCDTVYKYDSVIKKKYRWKDLRQEQIITAPRRFGKTQAVSMFVCAFALSKKNAEIAVFSTGSRASGVDTGMMGAIRHMLINVLKVPKENIHMKKEHLFIKYGDDDVRKIHAYPASNDTYVFELSLTYP